MRQIRNLDVFPKFDQKFEKDARQRTATGGILSLVALVLISFLVVSEVRYFLSVTEDHSVFVDREMGGDMTIKVNVTFHRVPCELIGIDSVDAFGIYGEGMAAKTVKTRIAADTLQPLADAETTTAAPAVQEGCPSCYGAEKAAGECCHTCEDVRAAYTRKRWTFNVEDSSFAQCAEERLRLASLFTRGEGCNLAAQLTVARVTGNLYFIPGRTFKALGRQGIDRTSDTMKQLNISHAIHALDFGVRFPGQASPLDGVEKIHGAPGQPGAAKPVNGRFSYFIKVVPTRYQTTSLLGGLSATVDSNQYSVTQHFTPSQRSSEGTAEAANQGMLPGVMFTYDLSPIRLLVSRAHPYPSVVHFVLQLCAICGGVLTVASLTDAAAFHGLRKIKKLREGKQF